MIVVGLDQMVSVSGYSDPFHGTEYNGKGSFKHPLASTIFSTKGENVTQLTHFVEVPSVSTALLCMQETGEEASEAYSWTS